MSPEPTFSSSANTLFPLLATHVLGVLKERLNGVTAGLARGGTRERHDGRVDCVTRHRRGSLALRKFYTQRIVGFMEFGQDELCLLNKFLFLVCKELYWCEIIGVYFFCNILDLKKLRCCFYLTMHTWVQLHFKYEETKALIRDKE